MNHKAFFLGCILSTATVFSSQAERYFQPTDGKALENSFGYVPSVNNPWAPPPAKSADAPPPAAVYEPPAHQPGFSFPAGPDQERYISEQELRELENVTEQSDLWSDAPPPVGGDALDGENEYSEPNHAGSQGAWGRLDTRGLVGNSAYRRPSAGSYAPYSFGMPGLYPPVPGFSSIMPGAGQMYQPNSYYNLTTPRLDTRTMDSINSGSYMNNSIAPFLY